MNSLLNSSLIFDQNQQLRGSECVTWKVVASVLKHTDNLERDKKDWYGVRGNLIKFLNRR